MISASKAITDVSGRCWYLRQNQDFVEEKFKELDSDQIEGAEFEF